METPDLLRVAREIIGRVSACMAITVNQDGDANARVVNVKPLSDEWTVRFATDLRSRKTREIERSGRLTLAYQYDPGNAYVTLVGHAIINNDVLAKIANWRSESYRWHPGGPEDPNVVYVDFTADRIELWSSSHAVEPDPVKGLWAAVLVREASGWCQRTSLPRPPPEPAMAASATPLDCIGTRSPPPGVAARDEQTGKISMTTTAIITHGGRPVVTE